MSPLDTVCQHFDTKHYITVVTVLLAPDINTFLASPKKQLVHTKLPGGNVRIVLACKSIGFCKLDTTVFGRHSDNKCYVAAILKLFLDSTPFYFTFTPIEVD